MGHERSYQTEICDQCHRLVYASMGCDRCRGSVNFAAPTLQSIAEKQLDLADAIRLHSLGVIW